MCPDPKVDVDDPVDWCRKRNEADVWGWSILE